MITMTRSPRTALRERGYWVLFAGQCCMALSGSKASQNLGNGLRMLDVWISIPKYHQNSRKTILTPYSWHIPAISLG